MRDRNQPRETHILIRGEYDRPGERVVAAIPASLSPTTPVASGSRLGLAGWLVDPANPLTARVIVNRYWQHYFGTGIVKTAEDFGSQGEWPSHPRLLDWLATEFIRSGWDVKAMQKTIVTSATYRQSSKVKPELLHRDPENRLLARASRVRLPAEIIRDQALATGGLLVDKVGGPSVRPYQPAGLLQDLASQTYEQDQGENLYRRSLYTFWKRTVPPPSMTTFDATARETCIVRRSRTNTPLQALALLNEVTYVEAARWLAEWMMVNGGATPVLRLRSGFRRVLGRDPSAAETEILQAGLQRDLTRYAADPEAAVALIGVGESEPNPDLDLSDLAAYTSLASLLLNLDETITRE